MRAKSIFRTVAAVALCSTAFSAVADEIVIEWWDFLGGGDGVRMKSIIDDFNSQNEGEIRIEATTLDWGVPFYTKVQTSVAVDEAPDLMTYHTSRIPLAVSQSVLEEITADDWAAMGIGEDSFSAATWGAVNVDGAAYAVPFDTHPIVLYYNKEKLAASGLIGDDGLPSGLDGIENFEAALAQLQADGTTWGLATTTADGGFTFRTIFSFIGQQNGELLTDDEWFAGENLDKLANALQVASDWATKGHVPQYTEYPAALALFTSGEAAMMINGVWEVPTMTDLHAKGELFEWGAIEIPVFFDKPSTYSDSHAFAIPNNANEDMSPEKRAAVLKAMRFVLDSGMTWATAGHIPALSSVTSSAEYQAMEPNATYAPLMANAIYDPKSEEAGVASPLFEAANNAITAAINGEMDPREAAEIMKEELDFL